MLGCWRKLETRDQLLQVITDPLILILEVPFFSLENRPQNFFQAPLIPLLDHFLLLRAPNQETQGHILPNSRTHLHIKPANIPGQQLAYQNLLNNRQILLLNAQRGNGLLEDNPFVEGKQDGFDLGQDVLDQRVGVDVLIGCEELLQPGQALGDAEPVVTRLQVRHCELIEVLNYLLDHCLSGCEVEDREDGLLNQQVVVGL